MRCPVFRNEETHWWDASQVYGSGYDKQAALRTFEDGKLRRFVNVFIDDEDVRFLSGLDTPIPERTVVSVIPAVAGG